VPTTKSLKHKESSYLFGYITYLNIPSYSEERFEEMCQFCSRIVPIVEIKESEIELGR